MNKMTEDYIRQKFNLDESIRDIMSIPKSNDYLIITELKIIRTEGDTSIKWSSGFHKDIILNAKLLKNKIKVDEFKNNSYYLDLNSGKLI